MDALDGEARSGEPMAAPRWPASAPAGARIDAGTLAAAAEVNRHHAQRLEAHRRDSMPVPQEIDADEPGERS